MLFAWQKQLCRACAPEQYHFLRDWSLVLLHKAENDGSFLRKITTWPGNGSMPCSQFLVMYNLKAPVLALSHAPGGLVKVWSQTTRGHKHLLVNIWGCPGGMISTGIEQKSRSNKMPLEIFSNAKFICEHFYSCSSRAFVEIWFEIDFYISLPPLSISLPHKATRSGMV